MKNTFNIDYLTYIEDFITEDRKQRFLDVLQNRTTHFTVVIEDVFQLHNTSAVMRTCEVFGIQELNVIEEKFGKDIDKEIAMGAQKWVDVNRYNSTTACIHNLKERGYKIIATSPHESSSPLDTFDITEPAALFFGTEKSGLSDEIIKAADGFVHIPMAGFTESLNISNSAAIIIQDITNRLRQSDIEWHLSEKEIIDKRIDWTRKTIKDIDFITQKYLEAQV